MLIYDIIDQGSDAIARRISSYNTSLIGILATALEVGSPTLLGMHKDVSKGAKDAYNSVAIDLNASVHYFGNEVLKSSLDALESPTEIPRDKMLTQWLESQSELVVGALKQSALRDHKSLATQARFMMLSAQMLQSKGMSEIGAIMQIRRQSMQRLVLQQKDNANRNWGSSYFGKIQMREFLVEVYVQTTLYGFAMQGISVAKAVGMDADGNKKETIFAIGNDSAGLPSINTVYEQLFHPNTRNVIEKV
jgi:hypothetical protein